MQDEWNNYDLVGCTDRLDVAMDSSASIRTSSATFSLPDCVVTFGLGKTTTQQDYRTSEENYMDDERLREYQEDKAKSSPITKYPAQSASSASVMRCS